MGGGILLLKTHSLENLLGKVYSDIKWNKSLFSSIDIWTNEPLSIYFVEWLKKQSPQTIEQARYLVNESKKSGTCLAQHLKSAFPQLHWSSLFKITKKTQFLLKECIEKMFVGRNALLLEEYRHPDVSNLELDYFLPQYNLAFEYQVRRKFCEYA